MMVRRCLSNEHLSLRPTGLDKRFPSTETKNAPLSLVGANSEYLEFRKELRSSLPASSQVRPEAPGSQAYFPATPALGLEKVQQAHARRRLSEPDGFIADEMSMEISAAMFLGCKSRFSELMLDKFKKDRGRTGKSLWLISRLSSRLIRDFPALRFGAGFR